MRLEEGLGMRLEEGLGMRLEEGLGMRQGRPGNEAKNIAHTCTTTYMYVHLHYVMPTPYIFPFSPPTSSLPLVSFSPLPRLKKNSTLKKGDCFRQRKEKLPTILREKRNTWNCRERCTKIIGFHLFAIFAATCPSTPIYTPIPTHTTHIHTSLPLL